MAIVLSFRYQQVIKFIIAGAAGAIVELLLFYVLNALLGMHYLVANFVALTVALWLNYVISFRWVFITGRYSRQKEIMAFAAVSIGVLVLNQLLMWFTVDVLGAARFFDELTDQLAPDFLQRLLRNEGLVLTKVMVIGLVAVINFVAKKYLVFKR